MKYEVWETDDEGCTGVMIFPVDENAEAKRKLAGKDIKLLRVIEAPSWNEAMTIHHQLMGWEAYVPEEDSE